MLETPSMQQYNESCENLLAADDQQGRPEAEPSTTTRTAPNNEHKLTDSQTTKRQYKNRAGYILAGTVWVRELRDGYAQCRDCINWKPIDQFSNVKGIPYTYCKVCQRIHKAMSRYTLTREQVVSFYSGNTCECCGSKFKNQQHKHIHHNTSGVVGLVCLTCNHTLRDESPEHLYRLKCCVRFIEDRVKI
jgi:hypothetical protein